MQQECSCRPVRRRCGTAMQSVDTEQGKRVYFALGRAKDRPVEVERGCMLRRAPHRLLRLAMLLSLIPLYPQEAFLIVRITTDQPT
ncbi:hypothetical protein [Paenibacillus sp. FSL H8-0537]|uniref:hypothetical protein n=1 Tax=Paenibacillus sp. FSL H8-0537 TaxID=2921399 RepID=UPI0031015506